MHIPLIASGIFIALVIALPLIYEKALSADQRRRLNDWFASLFARRPSSASSEHFELPPPPPPPAAGGKVAAAAAGYDVAPRGGGAVAPHGSAASFGYAPQHGQQPQGQPHVRLQHQLSGGSARQW